MHNLITGKIQGVGKVSASPEISPGVESARSRMSDLVESIGTPDFSPRLIRFLNRHVGASHFAAFEFGTRHIEPLAFSGMFPSRLVGVQVHRYVAEGWWQKDPAVSSARRQLEHESAGLVHLALGDGAYDELRPVIYPQIQDAVLVYGRCGSASFGLHVLRAAPCGEFSADVLSHLLWMSKTLISMLAKHVSFHSHAPCAANALSSCADIESCLLARSDLPKRELEVCARVLYGLPTVGISVDLQIGEESVKTYRKRAYQRLNIGSERELLQWYLREWSEWQMQQHKHAAAQPMVHLHTH
jgi:DNA-binding CsgD family transcriptional regulator